MAASSDKCAMLSTQAKRGSDAHQRHMNTHGTHTHLCSMIMEGSGCWSTSSSSTSALVEGSPLLRVSGCSTAAGGGNTALERWLRDRVVITTGRCRHHSACCMLVRVLAHTDRRASAKGQGRQQPARWLQHVSSLEWLGSWRRRQLELLEQHLHTYVCIQSTSTHTCWQGAFDCPSSVAFQLQRHTRELAIIQLPPRRSP